MMTPKHCDSFISNIINDVRGRQEMAYKVMKTLYTTEKDKVQINSINKQRWKTHYTILWYYDNAEEHR